MILAGRFARRAPGDIIPRMPGPHPARGRQPGLRRVSEPGRRAVHHQFHDRLRNAANRDVDARLEGDTRIVTIDGKEVYEVPLAAIEGG